MDDVDHEGAAAQNKKSSIVDRREQIGVSACATEFIERLFKERQPAPSSPFKLG